MSAPNRTWEYEGAPDEWVELGYSVDYLAYGPGDTVTGWDTLVEVTHLDGVEVLGPCSIVFDYGDPELTATDLPSMAAWIAARELNLEEA